MSYGSIAEALEGIVTTVEMNGPAILVDSAISFCTTLAHLRNTENPGASLMTSQRLIHWFFSRWSPGKCRVES